MRHRVRKQGSPEGWPSALQHEESLWDFVMQPAREARDVTKGTSLPYVPGDVYHGQSNLMGPWEDIAKTSVTGMKHQCQAQDKRWGHRAGSGVVGTAGACGGAAVLPG